MHSLPRSGRVDANRQLREAEVNNMRFPPTARVYFTLTITGMGAAPVAKLGFFPRAEGF